MKPLILQGHTRAITQVKYNREGDLLFTAAKDSSPNVWFSANGERLGTFDGHKGAMWCIDVNWQTKYFLSGSGDMTICVWDCETGKTLNKIEKESPVRTCSFGYDGNTVIYSTDDVMMKPCQIFMMDVRDPSQRNNCTAGITVADSKVTSLLWGPLDTTFITGHKNGSLRQWDTRANQLLSSVDNEHNAVINDLQPSKDGTMFITASNDKKSKLFDSSTLKCLKTYTTEKQVHSASISPDLEDVCMGGGPEPIEMSCIYKQGIFFTRFFHLNFKEEFGRVYGHFGPINSVAFNPSGTQFASGAEDGHIRIHNFDHSYFQTRKLFYPD